MYPMGVLTVTDDNLLTTEGRSKAEDGDPGYEDGVFPGRTAAKLRLLNAGQWSSTGVIHAQFTGTVPFEYMQFRSDVCMKPERKSRVSPLQIY